jgi:hypothetical protein
MALKYSKLSMFNVLGLYVNETMPVRNHSKRCTSEYDLPHGVALAPDITRWGVELPV